MTRSNKPHYETRFEVFAKVSTGAGGPAREEARTGRDEYALSVASKRARILGAKLQAARLS